jgi:hypothetical protein
MWSIAVFIAQYLAKQLQLQQLQQQQQHATSSLSKPATTITSAPFNPPQNVKVSQILVYPVKSCAGISLTSAYINK